MEGRVLDFYYISFSPIVGAFIAAFLTLAVFSFLYKDNPVYKFAEYLFIGVATGWFTIQEFNDSIMPNLVNHVSQAWQGPVFQYAYLWRICAGLLGIMLLLRIFPRLSWMSRWPLALMIGAYAGLKMIGRAEADLVRQVQETMLPKGEPILTSAMFYGSTAEVTLAVASSLIVFLGVLCVLIYFFFSFEHKGPIKGAARFGIITLMITFGAAFGFTVMGRVSLLIGRVNDLITFSSAKYYYGTFFALVLVVGMLVIWEVNNRRLEAEL